MKFFTRVRRIFWRATDGQHSRGQLPHIHLTHDQAYAWVRWPSRTVEYDIKRQVANCRKFTDDDLCHERIAQAMIKAYELPEPGSDITELDLPRWEPSRVNAADQAVRDMWSKVLPDMGATTNSDTGEADAPYNLIQTVTWPLKNPGITLPEGAYLGGSYPPEPVTVVDIVSAYPAAALKAPGLDTEWVIARNHYEDAMSALCRKLTVT